MKFPALTITFSGPLTISVPADPQLAALISLLLSMDGKLDLILKKEATEMAAIDDLAVKVARNATVTGSAIVLIQGIKAALDAAGTDPVKLAALGASLDSADDELAAAISANTPSAPPIPAV